MDTIDGQPRSLGDFKGDVVLLVNVASRCGLTPHYEGLEALYRRYKDRGFCVLGFPCNQFGAQEPGSAEEIKTFCSTNYDVSFPLFTKIEVNGDGRAPLYAYLTEQPTKPEGAGDIAWNFTKFLVDREGRVRARFAPTVAPEAGELVSAIEEQLG